MATYHLTAKTVSRGESASAARSDYIERYGRYRNDEAEVLHKGHGHMPAWAGNCPRNYWETADTHERANGRLFKQIEFALPKELSPQQQTELTVFVPSAQKALDAKGGSIHGIKNWGRSVARDAL